MTASRRGSILRTKRSKYRMLDAVWHSGKVSGVGSWTIEVSVAHFGGRQKCDVTWNKSARPAAGCDSGSPR